MIYYTEPTSTKLIVSPYDLYLYIYIDIDIYRYRYIMNTEMTSENILTCIVSSTSFQSFMYSFNKVVKFYHKYSS